MQFFAYLGVLVVAALITVLLAPKPPKQKPSTLEDLDIPTADEDRDIPKVFGTVRITGSNVVWYGDLEVKAIKKKKGGVFGIGKKKVTLGYRYYMGLHFALCYGPVDALRRILVGEREAWKGNVTDTGQIYVNKPELFGGNERDGGVQAYVDVLMGKDDQGNLDGYLFNQLGPDIPAFRGALTLVWQKGYIGNSPYAKPFAFDVECILQGWTGHTPWYPAKAPIPLVTTSEPVEPVEEGDTEPVVIVSTTDAAVRYFQTTDSSQLYYAEQFDDTIWPAGGMPFANVEDYQPVPTGFSSSRATPWDANSYMWVRRKFTLDDPSSAQIFFAVDNALEVWINGVYVSEYSGQGAPVRVNLTIPEGLLRTGENTIAWRAQDTGIVCYFAFGVVAQAGEGGGGTDPGESSVNAMNPAHIIYQCITDRRWGMGYPTSQIDEANFTAAADTFYAEGLGLCMQWVNSDTIQSFVQQVLDHVGAILYADPTTGLFALKLLRGDYDPADAPLFDESNIVAVESYQRAGYGETTNQITVVYRDFVTNKDTPVTVQDLANIQAQGAPVAETVQYPGLPTAALALRIAQRDLVAKATPLSKMTLQVDRSAWAQIPGDVVRVSWPKLGLAQVVCRVARVNAGNLTDGTIAVEVAEDVFGLPTSSYAEQQDSLFTPPATGPVAITQQTVLEASYYEVASSNSLAQLTDSTGVVQTLAAGGSATSLGYLIYSRTGSDPFEEQDSATYAIATTLSAALAASASVLQIAPVGLDGVTIGTLALIGSGATAEWAEVQSTATGSVTVQRAVADTTPHLWPVGTRVWFVGDDNIGTDPTVYPNETVVEVRLADNAIGGAGTSDTTHSLTIAQRFGRPYPPGKVRINGQAFPTLVTDALSVSWAHRDRIAQGATLVGQDADSVGPEAGTTYSAYAYDDTTNALLVTQAGISGTTWTPALVGAYRLRVEIEAVRDGLPSWQRQVRVFDYGADGRFTETGQSRLTEQGALRSQE